MPCRSDPAPGSVIAIAEIEVAGDQPGQPALLLLLGPEGGDVGDDDVVVHGKPEAAGAGPGGLLGEDHVVAEVLDARPAVLLVDVEAEQPAPRRPCATPRGRHAVLLPLLVEGDDLLLQEGARGGAEVLVLLLEDAGALRHGSPCRR